MFLCPTGSPSQGWSRFQDLKNGTTSAHIFLYYSTCILVFTCIKVLCSTVCKRKRQTTGLHSQTTAYDWKRAKWHHKWRNSFFYRQFNPYLHLFQRHLLSRLLMGKDWKYWQSRRLIRFLKKILKNAPLVQSAFFSYSTFLFDTAHNFTVHQLLLPNCIAAMFHLSCLEIVSKPGQIKSIFKKS